MKHMGKLAILFMVVGLLLAGCNNNDQEASANDQAQANTNDTTTAAKDDPVVVIDGKMFDRSDLAFYTLMEKIKIEFNRAEDQANLQGEELADKMDYWDEQLEQYENVNIGLQDMIEVNAMALLAEEKNYFVPDEKLEEKVDDFSQQVNENKAVEELIAAHGDDAYQRKIREYIMESTLRDRVVADLEEEIKEENPDFSELERNFLLHDKFEDLYMDQIADLEVEIKLK